MYFHVGDVERSIVYTAEFADRSLILRDNLLVITEIFDRLRTYFLAISRLDYSKSRSKYVIASRRHSRV